MSEDIKKELTPAAENPWYVLATIAGEQAGELIDWKLHERNRRYWNGWMAARLSDEERVKLLESDDWSASDIAPLSEDEQQEISAAFEKRGVAEPAPDDQIDFREVEFAERFVARGFFFSGNADFRSAAFSGPANFRSATFSGYANFNDGAFKASTDFQHARFEKRPPEFFNWELHENTDFYGASWPPPPESKDEAIQHRKAYERLKLIMEKQSKFRDEHRFFRREMRCSEMLAGSFLERWGFKLYRLVSDTGWSFERPLLWLSGLMVAGWLVLLGHNCRNGSLDPKLATGMMECWGETAGMSFASVFGFLGFGRLFFGDEFGALTGVSQVVSILLMVLGPVLLFFFFLALRNRFRMK